MAEIRPKRIKLFGFSIEVNQNDSNVQEKGELTNPMSEDDSSSSRKPEPPGSGNGLKRKAPMEDEPVKLGLQLDAGEDSKLQESKRKWDKLSDHEKNKYKLDFQRRKAEFLAKKMNEQGKRVVIPVLQREKVVMPASTNVVMGEKFSSSSRKPEPPLSLKRKASMEDKPRNEIRKRVESSEVFKYMEELNRREAAPGEIMEEHDRREVAGEIIEPYRAKKVNERFMPAPQRRQIQVIPPLLNNHGRFQRPPRPQDRMSSQVEIPVRKLIPASEKAADMTTQFRVPASKPAIERVLPVRSGVEIPARKSASERDADRTQFRVPATKPTSERDVERTQFRVPANKPAMPLGGQFFRAREKDGEMSATAMKGEPKMDLHRFWAENSSGKMVTGNTGDSSRIVVLDDDGDVKMDDLDLTLRL